MGFLTRGRHRPQPPRPEPPAAAQLRQAEQHPFRMLSGYIPLQKPEFSLYRSIREAVPVVDAAIMKLIRLAGGLTVSCPDKGVEKALNTFLKEVPTGWNQKGIQSFLDSYLDCLLTCGRAVGEMVLSRDGREISAVLCGSIADVEVKENGSPLSVELARRGKNGGTQVLPRQDLLLFTPYNPSPEHPYGASLMRSMPFLSEVLVKIYQTLGSNWERAGNVRFAVVYKPGEEGLDGRRVRERSQELARQWSEAMQSTKAGAVRDFVAVGDVDIKVIGAECDIPDCQAPVRLIEEQLVSLTGIPPFLLGLNWSSTERMSSQQADIMTSELAALRRTLTPVLERICRLWMHLHGVDEPITVDWEEIDLQDQVEKARAQLYRRQAEQVGKGQQKAPHPPAADGEDKEELP